MAIFKNGSKICATDIVTHISRDGSGAFVNAFLTFHNKIYTANGEATSPVTKLGLSDVPTELRDRYIAILVEIYETNTNQKLLGSDSAIP